jgi:hypothetical protein
MRQGSGRRGSPGAPPELNGQSVEALVGVPVGFAVAPVGDLAGVVPGVRVGEAPGIGRVVVGAVAAVPVGAVGAVPVGPVAAPGAAASPVAAPGASLVVDGAGVRGLAAGLGLSGLASGSSSSMRS